VRVVRSRGGLNQLVHPLVEQNLGDWMREIEVKIKTQANEIETLQKMVLTTSPRV